MASSPLLDALDVIDMPGSYFRGVLGGRPGERLSGSQLLNAWGTDVEPNLLLDMAVGIPTDPLTYLVPGAALAGRAAGKAGAKWLAAEAAKRGPMYGTSIDDVIRQLADDSPWREQLKAFPEIATEIPPGSTLKGKGFESLVFHHPETGQITKVTSPSLSRSLGELPEPRLDVADMLQPSRSKVFSKPELAAGDELYGSLRVDHEPMMAIGTKSSPTVPPPAFYDMASHLKGQGIDPFDIAHTEGVNYGNLGVTPTGRIMVTDPGSIMPDIGATIPTTPSVQGEASPLARALLWLSGSGNRMQRQLAKAAKEYRGGRYGTPFPGTVDELMELAGMSPTPQFSPAAMAAIPQKMFSGGIISWPEGGFL